MKKFNKLVLSFSELDEDKKRSIKGGNGYGDDWDSDWNGLPYNPWDPISRYGGTSGPWETTYFLGTLNEVTIVGQRTSPPESPSPYGYPIFDPFAPAPNPQPFYTYEPAGGGDGDSTPGVIPASQMTANPKMRQFLNNGEDFSSTVYTSDKNGGGGPPTIGFGHKLTPDEITNKTFEGKSISREEAIELFNKDIAIAISSAQRNIHVQVTQQQFDAYVSFVYQQGSSGAAKSIVNDLINDGNFQEAANALRHFSDNNTASPGLKHRRAEEADLFEQGDYTFDPY